MASQVTNMVNDNYFKWTTNLAQLNNNYVGWVCYMYNTLLLDTHTHVYTYISDNINMCFCSQQELAYVQMTTICTIM